MPTDGVLLPLLLFLIAAAAGYVAARLTGGDRRARSRDRLPADYFEGLSHLLDEDTDSAIEVFVRMVEVDSETVETHFALGALFRRRGEVDRAIRIHQNLIARPNLERDYRFRALFELGDDYMRAGLFDRAENLFMELIETPKYRERALGHLVTIYEQQKDWEQAIAARRRLETISGRYENVVIAHYYCELAESADVGEGEKRIQQHLKRAMAQDRDCVRASLISAARAMRAGEHRKALRQYRRVIEQDQGFVSEVIAPIAACYTALAQPEGFDEFVESLLQKHPEVGPGVALAAIGGLGRSHPVLARCVVEFARTDPHLRGVQQLVATLAPASADQDQQASMLLDAVDMLDSQAVRYRCLECGMKGTTLYWQCPSCKAWSSTRPSHEFGFSMLPASLPYSGFRGSLPGRSDPA